MTHDVQSKKHASVRDGVLILYFEGAETPFVARFDLDSLAQANFEVADKKDGFHTLVLRDYSGDTQTIGQFSEKADAQQALYDIVQALLNNTSETSAVCATANPKSCSRVKCFFAWLLKAIMYLLLAVLVIYGILHIPVSSTRIAKPTAPAATESNGQGDVAPSAAKEERNVPNLSILPEGEAVDADSILPDMDAAPAAEQE
jgi:hypothetical protein